MRWARWTVAVLSTMALATPVGAPEAVEYAEDHLDVPFVRDCHGLRPHHSECRRVEIL